MNNSYSPKLMPFLKGTALKRGAIFGSILICALVAFEVFNFSTTAFALHDVLGDLTFAGISWATMLAFAFCGIDFAGIARIFTPEQGRDEPDRPFQRNDSGCGLCRYRPGRDHQASCQRRQVRRLRCHGCFHGPERRFAAV